MRYAKVQVLSYELQLTSEIELDLGTIEYLERKRCFGSFCHFKWQIFFTGNSQISYLFSPHLSRTPGRVCDSRNQNQQTEIMKKGVNTTTEKRKWLSVMLV